MYTNFRPLRPEEYYGDEVKVPGKNIKNMPLRVRKAVLRVQKKGVDTDKIVRKGPEHDYRMTYNHELIDQVLYLCSMDCTHYDIELLMGITKEVIQRIVDGTLKKTVRTEVEQKRRSNSIPYLNTHSHDKVIEAAKARKERDLAILRNLRKLGYACQD